MKTCISIILLILYFSFSHPGTAIAQTHINSSAYPNDSYLKRPNVEIVVADVSAVKVIHINKMVKTQFKVIEVVRGEFTSNELSYLWPIEIPNGGNDQSKRSSMRGPSVGDRLILYGKKKGDNFSVYEAIQWTPSNVDSVKKNMAIPRTAKQAKFDSIFIKTIFYSILASSFIMIAIGRRLLNYLEQVRPIKVARDIKSLVFLSALVSIGVMIPIVAIPQLALILSIILISVGLGKYRHEAGWDEKIAQALFLAGIMWLLFFFYELKMRTWSLTVGTPIRLDLLYIAPIMCCEAMLAFSVAAVNLSDSERKKLTNRSSR
jgi:hypothetical protein